MNAFDKTSIFSRSNQLLLESVYSNINNYSTFIHVKSKFNEPWYNFIVPTTTPPKFSWKEAEKVIGSEKSKRVLVSYYIHGLLIEEYQTKLEEKGYKKLSIDAYMSTSLNERFADVSGNFVPVSSSNLEEYIKLAKACFPDWQEVEEYTRYFYKLSKKKHKTLYKNLLLKIDEEFISFGSIIISPEKNLAYLHNAGTAKEHRRKGHFTQMTKYLCNAAFNAGVRDVYGLVEEESISYKGLLKLGFNPEEVFYIYQKN